MSPLPRTPELEALAARMIWFEPAEKALSDPIRFMAYVMSHATVEDLAVVRHYFTDNDFREALDKAPPGIIDARSWAYWNVKFGRYPTPPMPRRRIP